MRKVSMAALILVVWALMASCSSDGDDATSTTTEMSPVDAAPVASAAEPPPDVPLLGVVNATGGTFDGDRLTLTGVPPSAVWFTDRPVRSAGFSPVEDFLPLFFGESDPPNAALELTGADEGADIAVVELSDPSWDADRGELTFEARVIPELRPQRLEVYASLNSYTERNDGDPPARFGTAALFIDAGVNEATLSAYGGALG